MSRNSSIAMMAGLALVAGFAGVSGLHDSEDASPTIAGDMKRQRSPEASAERLSARQERMRRKAAKRSIPPSERES